VNARSSPPRRWGIGSCIALVVVTGALVALPGARTTVLTAAGRALVIDDPIESADIIVVTIDAGAAGLLEAADLVHSGIATRAALFGEAPDSADREFQQRLPAYENANAVAARQLRSLGVESVESIPVAVTGTTDEGQAFAEWCQRRGFRSVVVVSASDHSRRVRRVLHRSMKGQPTKIMVRSARFSPFKVEQWWQTRAGTRSEVVELEKLLLDVVRHPLS
jgi:hypothetical protein